jgi:N-methylhydantoinase A
MDIGGTFTDVVIADGAGLHRAKSLTTPADPTIGLVAAVGDVLDASGTSPADITRAVHGTTLATNVVLERRGAPLAYITTAGFRTMLALGRYARVEHERYQLTFVAPEPLVPLSHCFEVPERMSASGEVVRALDEAAARQIVATIAGLGVASVAICLMHSYANPAHEQQLAALCRQGLPGVVVVASSATWPEIREHERASTTLVSAYVGPVMSTYLERLEQRLAALGIRAPVQIMESSGGVMSAGHAAARAVFTIESGPAASVVAAAEVGRRSGRPDLIAFDMGGTTAKVALVRDGRPDVTHDLAVGGSGSFGGRRSGTGTLVKIPTIDLAEVGAGGGSIAWVDDGGALRVGPRSAGAEPGPAAYGRGGTEPTVTDADLVLGYLDPASFAGGTMALRADLAEASVGGIAIRLRVEVPIAALAIHEIVNSNMAAAVDVVTVQRGVDPGRFALFASGGAGPMHVARIAEHFGIGTVVVPAASGVASAVGMLSTDLRVERARSCPPGDEAEDPAQLTATLGDLALAAATELGVDLDRDDLTVEAFVDLRYRGQSYDLTIPAPDRVLGPEDLAAVRKQFLRSYQQAYGILLDAPTELVGLRVRLTRSVPRVGVTVAGRGAGNWEPAGTRSAYFAELGGFVEVAVYDRAGGAPGDVLAGPVIVEEAESTLLVPPAWSGRVDERANIVLDRTYGA